MILKTAVEHIKILFAMSLSKDGRYFDMLTKWVNDPTTLWLVIVVKKLLMLFFYKKPFDTYGRTVNILCQQMKTITAQVFRKLLNYKKVEIANN